MRPGSEQQSWWQRNWGCSIPLGCGGCLLLLVLVIAALVTFTVSGLRTSWPYAEALELARSNDEVVAALGEPIEASWSLDGSIHVAWSERDADLEIPIAGPRDSGTLFATAHKRGGEWEFERVEVEIPGRPERIDLLGGGDTTRARNTERNMSQAEQHRRVDYVEFAVRDLEMAKAFYSGVFGWEFTDYGPDYTSFFDGRLSGGFRLAEETAIGGPLIVLYSSDLEQTQSDIERNGGTIVRDPFEFPGGRRFHFTDPSGIELAVWSDR